ncbi:MAG: hypothetical protein H0X33_09460 [Taibaiella sp.]|nr:hypothetical protein [Taibaiella sp.]
MQALYLLSEKLDVLLKKYASLQAENTRLKATVSKQISSIEALNAKLAALEEQTGAAAIAQGIATDDHDKENMRKQLDTVISDIDKILNTLND